MEGEVMLVMLVTLATRTIVVMGGMIYMTTMGIDMGGTVRWRNQEKWTG